ncbi:MAG: TFIIB-type zinc ribbon-containing protein [Bacilli bacterium]|nr:TFIIB-type zinc ribbon-containing protein [Bacilli bacterium]
MKIIEENKLNQQINIINEFTQNKSIKEYFDSISSLQISSLQDISFEEDIAFFDEVSFILSVIASIINHPHLTNKAEDIIIRSELAGSIPADAFNQVVKEPILWREKDYEMVPENVHYYEYTDELKIYENIFIVMLIKLISTEMDKYLSFYVSKIPSFTNSKDTLLNTKDVEIALNKIDKIIKRISFIKDTFFFKEVSKAKVTFKYVQPTNILTKNRLYNLCFKFYKKFIKYEDQDTLINDLGIFYFNLLLKKCKEKNFILDESKNQSLEDLSFHYNDYDVNVKLNNSLHKIELLINDNNVIKHNLWFNLERKNNNYAFTKNDAYTDYVISAWNLNNLSNLTQELFNTVQCESNLIEHWLNLHFMETVGSKLVYSRYCPICKSKEIVEDNGLFNCSSCGSIYRFKNNKEEDRIWFIRLRG